ncbi:hypothetical protein CMV_017359 [Castanea mollissima]|uniref:Uncharacterized protein n=1 Tax=Castanea mollissima TaxID=60419 RepID=A0A8J4R5I3_9ROSI|nr:hypothetical protein CMV_017359 [Castanea mollissima]
MNRDATKEEDKGDGHVLVESECSEPSEEEYGPWVIVSRKKKFFKNVKKDLAQQPSYGMAHLLKSHSPDQAESPMLYKPDPSVHEKRDTPLNAKSLPKVSAPAVNRTNQTKAKDKPKTSLPQSTSKVFSRNTWSSQWGRGVSMMKEHRQKQSVECSSSLLGKDSDHLLIKPMIFSVDCNVLAKTESLTEVGFSTLSDVGQGESMDGVGSEEMKVPSAQLPLRDISNQPPSPIKDVSEIVATAALNILVAELKHIDPKLRPPKKGNEVIPSLCSVQEEDNMVLVEISTVVAQRNQDVDSDGMLIEGGGEPSALA